MGGQAGSTPKERGGSFSSQALSSGVRKKLPQGPSEIFGELTGFGKTPCERGVGAPLRGCSPLKAPCEAAEEENRKRATPKARRTILRNPPGCGPSIKNAKKAKMIFFMDFLTLKFHDV
jgi:hypothetical protein